MARLVKDNPLQIMKNISMFDIDEDYDNIEARKQLDLLFHTLIMSDNEKSREFIERFLDASNEIIYDMGLIDKPEEQDTEDVYDGEEGDDTESDDMDMGGDGEEVEMDMGGDTDDGGGFDMGEPADEEDEGDDDIPDGMLGDSYNPLVDAANSFLYI